MGITSRKRRPLERRELQNRDDSIFVVVSEDRYAVDQYFAGLRFSRLKVVVLPTTDSRSAPRHLVERLHQARQKYDWQEGDQLWLVLDTDHWVKPSHLGNLTDALRAATRIGAMFALSNPCFETWLLLHHAEDLSVLQDRSSAREVHRFMKSMVPGGYRKDNLDPDCFTREQAEAATDRAERCDPNPGEWWPRSPGTHMHRLMRSIFACER